MSELNIKVRTTVVSGAVGAKVRALVMPDNQSILKKLDEIALEQEEQNNAIDRVLQEAKDYTDNELATFDFIKIVNVDSDTGLPSVENPLPNKIYLVPKTTESDNDFFDTYIWANKGTEESPEYVWDFQGTKKVEVDLTDYVKNTDYATSTKVGVVKVSSSYGISASHGSLALTPATDTDIDSKTNAYKPIVSKTLDYAVKVGITTNTESLTDEEKAAALAWLGAVATTTNGLTIYGTDVYGNQTTWLYRNTNNTKNTVAGRDSNGNIQVGTAVNPTDCVNLQVLDGKIAELVARIEALE